MLIIGECYQVHSCNHFDYFVEIIARLPGFNSCSYLVRSIKTGWTMKIHGVQIHSDGSIEWNYSTCGMFTTKNEDGSLTEDT